MTTLPRFPGRRACWILLLVAWITTAGLSATSNRAVASETTAVGLKVYQARCSSCHGASGEGDAAGNGKLMGDKTIEQLTDLIQQTMPEDDPGSLSAEEAAAVAAYVHHEFYSAIAQARRRPPRIELARLTVEQHRRVLADLVGTFRRPVEVGGEPGLAARYFNGRHLRGDNESVTSRVDPKVDFNFGTEPPTPEITDARNYSVRWTGSLIPPETGLYEFALDTAHAARLWVNGPDEPTIDYWVRSDNDSDVRARVYLLGGRAYPLRLDFSRATQGVSDENVQKKNLKEEDVEIHLLWKRPGGVLQPIASRYLNSQSVPESYVCSVAFPPDDRSYGWERGTTVSREWDEATTEAALATADYVEAHLEELVGTRANGRRRQRKLREFANQWVERALRYPLSKQARETLVETPFAASDDPDEALRHVLLLSLKSPEFLFRELGTAPEAFDTASRISFTLWDSLPDEQLLAAARDGRLATDEEIRTQARRMMADPRARGKLMRFLLTWLQVDSSKDLGKDPKRYPGFDEGVIADLRTSLELMLAEAVESDRFDFRQLLLARHVHVNKRLAEYYGAEWQQETGEFVKLELDGGRRAGVLTHPYLMTHFANNAESSPIHRGVFLARSVLGQALKPPPEAVAPLAPDLHPDLTTRERVALQTQPSSCMTCHATINPLGFTLERFDAVGKWRDEDANKPVDDHGEYVTVKGESVSLPGARPLAEFLASSEEVHRAFVENLFHFLVQQSAAPYGADTIDSLRQRWAESEYDLRTLAVEIVVATARQGRDTQTDP